MRPFQLALWEERARDKCSRAGSRGPARARSAQVRLWVDLAAARGLERVVDWAAGRGLTVLFTSKRDSGVFSSGDKTIYINSTLTPEHQLFVLLHECGHVLVGSEKPGVHHRFKLGYPSWDDPGVSGKLVHRCAILEEEFEAWHRGHRLAKKLGVPLDEDRWAEIKTRYIKSYLKWTINPTRYKRTT